jgi:hypothetical protein
MPADCELDSCGELPVGPCAECAKAMCASHRAQGENGPIVNRCAECERRESQRRLEIFQGLREYDSPAVQRELHAQERIKKIARRLAETGIVPDTPATEGRRVGRGLLGRRRKEQGVGSLFLIEKISATGTSPIIGHGARIPGPRRTEVRP